ncbi:MAG TPA: glycosyltransferase, partial [Gemmataceae bacterium]|nr:glycosyltransferase [Gemmataceae bacterium]
MLCWALVLVAVGVRVLVLPPGARSLFPVFRQAGEDWAEQHDLYPETVQGPNYPLFRYSPAVATAFAPFALLDTKPGDLVWRVFNTGVLVGGVYWALRRLPQPALSARQLAIVFALMVPPALGHLSNGQCNAMVIGLVLAGYAAAADRRWNLSAVALAAATLLKLYPAAPALLLTALHPRQLGPRYAVALATGFGLPFALGEPSYVAHQYDLWVRYFSAEDRSAWPIENTNVDFQLLARVWANPIRIETYRVVEVGAGLAFAALTVGSARRWRSAGRAAPLALGLGSVWMTTFGPATESPTYLLLAPSACLAVVSTWARYPQDLVLRWLTLIAYALPLSVQLTAWYQPLFYAYRTMGPQPVAGLLLAAALLWADRRARESVARMAPRSAENQASAWAAWAPTLRAHDRNHLTSLVIPVYNPGPEIERTWYAVTELIQSLDKPWEVIFVCDGCTDGTLDRLRALAATGKGPFQVLGYPVNRGKGYAVRTGLAVARGRWLLFTDADLAYSPDDVVRVADHLWAGAAVAVACREHP